MNPDYALRLHRENAWLKTQNAGLKAEIAKLRDEQAPPVTLRETMSEWRIVIERPEIAESCLNVSVYGPSNSIRAGIQVGPEQLVKFAHEILERYGKDEEDR